jgi:(R)-amidase
MNEIKVASIQMDIKQGDKATNLSKAAQFLKKASEEKVNLACLSEYFSTGFDYKHLKDLAEPIPGPTTKILQKDAKQYKMWIAAPILEKKNGKLSSTLTIIKPDGRVLCAHRKVHLWVAEPRQENKVLTPGEGFEVVKLNGAVFGSIIDADMDFPEAARILGLKGAEILFIPLDAELPYLDVIRLVPIVRALDNVAYVVTANRVGRLDGFDYAGGSMIISPLGEVMASIGNREGMITATLDLAALREWRKEAWSPFKRFNTRAYGDLKNLLQL